MRCQYLRTCEQQRFRRACATALTIIVLTGKTIDAQLDPWPNYNLDSGQSIARKM